MRDSLNESVSVVMYYSASSKHVQPYQLHWQGQDYKLGKVDFWHKTRQGDVLLHHFSLSDVGGTAYFKLALDTSNLHWTLEEYMTADQLEVTYERHEA